MRLLHSNMSKGLICSLPSSLSDNQGYELRQKQGDLMAQNHGSRIGIAGLLRSLATGLFYLKRSCKEKICMFEVLKDISCFVTAFVSFLYGSRIAWGCGIKCQFSEEPEDRIKSLCRSLPAAALIYFIGFVILSSYLASGYFTRFVFSVTSAVILSHFVTSMAMPELRRKPPVAGLVLAELTDGSASRIAKKTFNVLLANGKVVKFKRSDGWVLVGRDRLREMHHDASYAGVERRIAA